MAYIGLLKSDEPSHFTIFPAHPIGQQFEPLFRIPIENNLDTFPQCIPKNYKPKLKCIIIIYVDFPSLLVCQRMDERLKNYGVPYFFVDISIISNMCALISSQIIPKTGEKIFSIFIDDDRLRVIELLRKDDGYEIISNRIIKFEEIIDDAISLFKQIIPNNPPDQILLCMDVPSQKGINLQKILETNVLKSLKIRKPRKHYIMWFSQALAELFKHLLDPSIEDRKFYIKPLSKYAFSVTNGESRPDVLNLFKIEKMEHLPSKKQEIIMSRTHKAFYLHFYYEDDKSVILSKADSRIDCHKLKISFSIDINYMPKIDQEPIILDEIKDFYKTLNKNVPSKIPVIGFFENLSFILLWNEKKNTYEFLNQWNGVFGKDIFLSFKNEKPKIVDDSNLDEHVVYDLIKIMSMPPNSIENNPKWLFEVFNDEKNEICLKFKNHDGTTKMATPAFLMALILKDHLKVIKEENGGKTTEELAFYCFGEEFTKKDRRRIKIHLEEACKLLNIKFNSVS